MDHELKTGLLIASNGHERKLNVSRATGPQHVDER
jgi:hypothetical protein